MLISGAVWFGNAIVIPMRDSQTKFMEAVIGANDLNAKTNNTNALVNQQNTTLLTRVIDNQGTVITSQKHISDTQATIVEMHKEDAKYRGEYLKLLEQIRDKAK